MNLRPYYFQISTKGCDVINTSDSFSQVNVFYGDSKGFINRSKLLEQYLSELELDRKEKFKFIETQICYVVSHSLLKKKIFDYLNCKENDICFEFFKDTKPFLKGANLDFNISHSGNLFAFVFSGIGSLKVGIDIEIIKPLSDIRTISEGYFSENEQAYIYGSHLDENQQLVKFYEVWTRKEAFLKMLGIGLNVELKKISVSEEVNTIEIDLPPDYDIYSGCSFITTVTSPSSVMSVCVSQNVEPCFHEIIDAEFEGQII